MKKIITLFLLLVTFNSYGLEVTNVICDDSGIRFNYSKNYEKNFFIIVNTNVGNLEFKNIKTDNENDVVNFYPRIGRAVKLVIEVNTEVIYQQKCK